MGTNVNYNGITMKNALTRRFVQSVAYDDSGTDRIGSKFECTWECLLHAEDVEVSTTYITNPQQGNGQSAQAAYQVLRKYLEEPRKALHVTVDSETILRVNPANLQFDLDEAIDTDNGPKPRNVEIVYVGGNTFRISFSIECTILESSQLGSRTLPVISNRWSVKEDIGPNFYITRTISGRMKLTTANVPAHAYKAMVVPGRERGFKREEMSFTVDATGLNCDYTIVDRQVHTAAPTPAVAMSVTHTESTNDGVTFFSELSVRLTGGPDTPKPLLFLRMFQIADAKINLSEKIGQSQDDNLVENFTLIDHIGEENIVEGTFRFRNFGDAAEILTKLKTDTLGQPLELPAIANAENPEETIEGSEYDPQVSRFPALYGYNPHDGVRAPAVAFILSCYLQVPTDDRHAIAQFDVTTGEEGDDQSKAEIPSYTTVQTVESLPEEDRTEFSDSHRSHIYLFAKMESTYANDSLRVQMPIAGSTGGGSADTSAVVTLARGLSQREIVIDAERVGEWPELPTPLETYLDGPIRATLLRAKITPVGPCKGPDGRKLVFRIMASYVYALSRPYAIGDTVPVGHLPFTSFSPGQTAINTMEVFKTDLLT